MNYLHIGFWVFAIVYFNWCLQILARKTGTQNDWLAWVPGINIFYMAHVAGRPWWFGVLLFVPVVNLYALYRIWGDIAVKRGRPDWIGYLMLVPVINYMTMTNLALKDEAMVKA